MQRALLLVAFALGLFTITLPEVASAQQLRYSTTAPGRIIGTGNTLGLSKQLNANGPGTEDSIGTFISLNPGAFDLVPVNASNPWFGGTTNDWTQNGSAATVQLPPESKVLYAELVWGGSYNYGGEDVTSSLGTSVTLKSGANTLMAAPDPATQLTIASTAISGFAVNYYMRSANVTQFVQTAKSGTYSLQGVPCTQSQTINQLNACGWTLVVVVRDDSQPVRNLSVYIGGSFVDENGTQDYTFNSLCTPPSGAFTGSAVISAIEGDANRTGDQLLISQTTAGPFTNLSGPNNPVDNFFCSQINGADGMLDTSGTFGNLNANAATGVDINGGRQGWDITTIGLTSQSGQLVNGQTSAVLRTTTTGDSYVPIVAAFAIDVNAPVFTNAMAGLAVNPTSVTVGDTFTVTTDVTNSGLVTAQNALLTLPLDPGLMLTSFTMDGVNGDINGNPVNQAMLGSGVNAGNITPGAARHVVIKLTVTAAPQGGATLFPIQPKWSYGYTICTGGAPQPESYTQFGDVTFTPPMTTSTGTGTATTGTGTASNGTGTASNGTGTASNGTGTASNGTGTASNGTGTAGNGTGTASNGAGTASTGAGMAAGGAGGGNGSGLVKSSGGCNCSVPDEGGASWGLLAGALGAAAFVRRRARR